MANDPASGDTPLPDDTAERSDLRPGAACDRNQEGERTEGPAPGQLGTWRWLISTDTVMWSDELYRALGLDPDPSQPGYVEIRKVFTPESWMRFARAAEHGATTGAPCRTDAELALPDGSRRRVLLHGERAQNGSVFELRGDVFELRGPGQEIAECKMSTEQQLARSEARYRSLVRATSEVVWTAAPEGSHKEANAEWRAFTGQAGVGQTARQMRGYAWADAIHPEDRQRTIEAWQRAVERGTQFQIEHRLRRHDGVYRWMRACAVPSRDASGKIVEWVGMHTDITEQVQTEAALRDSQGRFQRLYEAGILGIATAGSDGVFFEGNDEFLRIVGYSLEELRAGLVRWDKMTPPEYAELDAIQMAAAAEHGSCTPYEKEYLRRDGTRVPVQCGYALLEGSREEYIGFLTDLTAQKEVEHELREREHRFRELAETLPELIWVTGTDGWSEYVNERFIEYTGIAASQLSGNARTEIIHPEDREQVMTKWARSVETGEAYVNTLRLRRHDGAYRTFLARSMPIRNAGGQIVRWMGTATDVHDQRLAEEALRRTEKLAATGRLAASIAHEINNPLAAVMNSLYLALQMEMNEPARAYLQTAEQQLARVAQVTTQTLRFHRQATAAAPADLSEIMESAIAMYASRFRSQGIAVEREYRSRERLLCYGDELRQVFANLLANSLDATRRGGRVAARIRDSCDWASMGGESGGELGHARRGVRVTLADTGHGIDHEVRRQIFEPFVSTKQDTGTGLGLWVSEGIVRKHGGRIAMHSRTQPPSGTVFMLFLPVVPVDAAFPGDALA